MSGSVETKSEASATTAGERRLFRWFDERYRLADVIRLRHTDRIRYAAPDRVARGVREAVIENCIHIADTPVLMQGRLELLWYMQEQSVCVDYHRYGNLGIRADEPRSEPQ